MGFSFIRKGHFDEYFSLNFLNFNVSFVSSIIFTLIFFLLTPFSVIDLLIILIFDLVLIFIFTFKFFFYITRIQFIFFFAKFEINVSIFLLILGLINLFSESINFYFLVFHFMLYRLI